MPKIPVINSQASIQVRALTKEAPAVRIPAESFVHEARAMSQFGVTIANIAEDIIKVKADQEYAKAKIEGFKTLSQIEAEAAKDDDFQNFEPKYTKRIKDTQETILKTIRSPQAKQAFQNDFELKSTYSFYDIMADGRKRFLDYDKDLMAQETVTAKERYFSASTDGEKQNAKDELAQIFSRRRENKILNKAEAANLYQEAAAGLDEGQAEYDILGNPVYALGELQKGKQGAYKELVQDKRVDLIRQAEARIEKLKNQQEETVAIAMNQRKANLIDMKIAGTLTEQQVKNERQLETISAKFADTMISTLRRPKKEKPKDATFNKLVDFMLNPENKEEDIRLELLKENAKGEITDEDLSVLYTFNQEVIKPVVEGIIAKQSPKGFLQKISFWSDEYADDREEVKAAMYKNYMQRIKTGEAPEVAVKNTISTFKKMTIYDIGQILSTPKGHVKVIGYDADGESIIELVK